MAIGDDATAAGFAVVAANGLVKDGGTEINRTRDYVAQVKTSLNTKLVGTVTSGTSAPLNTVGNDGDIYFKIII